MSQFQPAKRKLTAGRALALLPLTLLSALGCSQIIGLSDYDVAPSGGSGGSAGTVSNAGSANGGSGGKAGGSSAGSGNAKAGESAGGEAGALGEAGTGGSSGSSTTGGSAGSAGGPATGPLGCDGKTTFTLNDGVVRSCILRMGCDPFEPVRSISTCVTNNTQDAFAGERCNLKSTTCADYEACEHNGIAGDDLCPSNRFGTDYCSGTKAVSCTEDGQFSSWIDCVGVGGTACGTYVSGGVTVSDCLVNESCVGTTPGDYTCSTEATPLYEYQCTGNKAYGFKCGDFAYCDDSSGTAGCYLTAQTCGADSTTCSTTNIAKVCSGGGEYDYDCGSVGLKCQVGAADADGDTNYCLAPGCKPADVNTCAEFCNGSKLDFCYGGAQVEVDCTDYGFTGCLDGLDNGDELTSYATCVN
ncbi:MAG TPA: hypothetical protein VHV51_10955 [Polyangiaceae bacterium]|jgi:hypothetical protein|nr:hypothetical protein [Polyangiaceae bacterium]